MFKKILLLFIFSFLTFLTHAQVRQIEGTLRDTFNIKPVVYAAVSLIRKTDSTLITFTRTAKMGVFHYQQKTQGDL